MAPSAGRLPHLCLQHLGRVVPDGVELLEMICESCMNKNGFLWTYAAHLAGSLSSHLHGVSPFRSHHLSPRSWQSHLQHARFTSWELKDPTSCYRDPLPVQFQEQTDR